MKFPAAMTGRGGRGRGGGGRGNTALDEDSYFSFCVVSISSLRRLYILYDYNKEMCICI
jgi:hypothetical protein